MYNIDKHDRVVKFDDIPHSYVGAPKPIILAGERDIPFAYYFQDTGDGDGMSVGMIDTDSGFEPMAIIKFKNCHVHMFERPNDETINGHPLSQRGLEPPAAGNASRWLLNNSNGFS